MVTGGGVKITCTVAAAVLTPRGLAGWPERDPGLSLPVARRPWPVPGTQAQWHGFVSLRASHGRSTGSPGPGPAGLSASG